MAQQRHRIGRQVLEVVVPQEPGIREAQNAFRDVYYSHLLPVLERVLDEMAPPDHVIRLDYLELDLSAIGWDMAAAPLMNALEKQLRQQMAKVLEDHAEAVAASGNGPKTAASEVEVLLYYLLTGQTPLWLAPAEYKASEALRTILKAGAAQDLAQIRSALIRPAVVRRIAWAFPIEAKEHLLQTLAPAQVPALQVMRQDLASLHRSAPLLPMSNDLFPLQLWETILGMMPDLPAGVLPFGELLGRLVERLLPAAVFAPSQRAWLLGNSLRRSPEAVGPETKQAIAAWVAAELSARGATNDKPMDESLKAIAADLAIQAKGEDNPQLDSDERFPALESDIQVEKPAVVPEDAFQMEGEGSDSERFENILTGNEEVPPALQVNTDEERTQGLESPPEKLPAAEKENRPLLKTPATQDQNGPELLQDQTVLERLQEQNEPEHLQEQRKTHEEPKNLDANQGDAVVTEAALETPVTKIQPPIPVDIPATPDLPPFDAETSETPTVQQHEISRSEQPTAVNPDETPAEEVQAKKEANPAQELAGTEEDAELDAMPDSLMPPVPPGSIQERFLRFREMWAQNPEALYPMSKAEPLHIPWGNEAGGGSEVSHVGLVILWPYLGSLFKRLGWMEKKDWVGEESQFRAVLLLRYLAKGDATPVEDHELAFCKVLAGLGTSDPVPLELSLTPDQLHAADELLDGVLANWAAVKKTSRMGLRNAFLDRTGILRSDMEAWTLHVERTTMDVLLDRLPWGYSTIRLAWLQKMIYVEW